jgi:Rha family phage regulatory protein
MNAPSRPVLSITNGHATTTSTQIAEHFGKRHDTVLRTIRNLECSPEYHARNFAEMVVEVEIGSGATRNDPAYTLTRDGFVFLAMGFTGKQAAQWKEAYIEAFNAMETTLQHGAPSQDNQRLIENLRRTVVSSNQQFKDAMRYACMGLTMQEVGKLIGCGPRQVRDVFGQIRTLGLAESEAGRGYLERALADHGTAHRQQTLRDLLDSMWKEDAEASKTPRQLDLEAQAEQRAAAKRDALAAKKTSHARQMALGGAQ